MPSYGIGLTTFREKKKENWIIPPYMDAKRGNMFLAAKKVNRHVRESIDWSEAADYKGYPALGVYEGGIEPASHVYITTSKDISLGLEAELRGFKELACQDSILLYKFVKSGGNPVLEIKVGHGVEVKNIRRDIMDATSGKIGGYLTYIYSLHRIVIVNVPEFDGLTAHQFRKLITDVRRGVKPYNGKVTVKQAKITVI